MSKNKKDEKVFLLSKREQNISHDIPFEENYSGAISIEITAKSPIFIRNHYVVDDEPFSYRGVEGSLISKKFCHFQGIPYIPSSSIKGMIRNCLEIISYGKLRGKTSDDYLKEKTEQSSLHRSEEMDLSEAIFGTTELKGRVQFSHFKVEGDFQEEEKGKREVLMTPEAKKKKFGWKKYPILNSIIESKKGNNDDIVSEFIPLKSNTKFRGKLRFHNLRDFELGAIISALSFHNTKECYHNIGLAKSLGYGKIDIQFSFDKTLEVLKAFEEKLNLSLFEGKVVWHRSFYIKELLTKHSHLKHEFEALSDAEDLKLLYQKQKIEKESETQSYYNELLKKENLEVPSKKQLKKAIELYFKKEIKPYFDMKHLDECLNENFIYTPEDIQESYRSLFNSQDSKLLVDLLSKRKKGEIVEKEMSILYYILQK